MRFGKSLLLHVGVAVLISVSGSAYAQSFYLHSGDRVTFYGDSITAQRFYTRDIQDFVETRYPDLKVEYHNAGVSGDKVSGGYAGDAQTRVDRDVKPWEPTVITVMLGMNDGDYVPPDPKIFSDYQSGYEKLIAMLRASAPQARITLIENTPYDEITHGTEFVGYMASTEQNAKATPSLGQRENLPVIDDCTPIKALLERAKAADTSYASLLVPDRIHPSEPLHWIMAESVMTAWHVNPVVSEVVLSAVSQTPVSSSRTRIAGLTAANAEITWDQRDEALPLPLNLGNALMSFVLKVSDLASWDKEMLRIQDLAPGEYKLKIDKADIGNFSAQELAQGVNLALLKTPMWQQAREYDGALERRSALEDADFYLFAETNVPEKAATSRLLREGEAAFEEKAQSALNIPVHHYSVTRLESVPQ